MCRELGARPSGAVCTPTCAPMNFGGTSACPAHSLMRSLRSSGHRYLFGECMTMLLSYCSPRVCVKCAPSGVYLPGGWGSIGFKSRFLLRAFLLSLSPPSFVWPARSAVFQSQSVAASCRSYKRNRAPVQAEEKVAAYLMRLSSAASYRHLGAVFDMSETHVRICCRQVGTALLTRYATEVRLPTHDEAVLSGVEFAHRYGTHGCIGAVDGTHIPFRC